MAALEVQHQQEILQLTKNHQEVLLQQQQLLQAELLKQQEQLRGNLLKQQDHQQPVKTVSIQVNQMEDEGTSESEDGSGEGEGEEEEWELDEENYALLLKIIELGPSLLKESGHVKDLSKMLNAVTRPAGAYGTGHAPRSTISPQLINQFEQLLQEIRNTKMDLPAEGWTKKILDALEKVLDQEREILSATMAASRPGAPPSGGEAGGVAAGDVGSRDKDALLNCYRQLVDQISRQGQLLQSLQKVDYDSFVAEINRLKSELDTARASCERETQENRALSSRLNDERHTNLSQVRQLQESLDKAHLTLEHERQEKAELSRGLGALRESSGGTIHELQFQLELEKSQVKELVTRTAALYGELASKDSNLSKLEAENRRFAEALGAQEEAEAQQKTMESRHKVMEAQHKSLEESMARASQTIQSLQEEVSSSHAHEAELRQSLSQSRTCIMELKSQLTGQQKGVESVAADLQQAETALNCTREELAEAHRAKGALQMECAQLKNELVRESKSKKWGELLAKEQEVTASLGSELAHATEATARLQSELTQAKDRHLQDQVVASSKLQEMRAELLRSQREVGQLSSQHSTRTREEAESRRELDELRRRQHLADGKVKMLSEELSRSEKAREDVSEEYSQYRLKAQQWQTGSRELVELKGQLKELENELAESKNLRQSGLDAAKALEVYEKYRQAELHRKSLVFQKLYLQCHLDAFYQTQQVALKMMADMGAPMLANRTFPPPSKFSRPYARFRAVGAAVCAAIRFRFICRKKTEYLQSKREKINAPGNGRNESIKNAAKKFSIRMKEETPRSNVPAPTSYSAANTVTFSSLSKPPTDLRSTGKGVGGNPGRAAGQSHIPTFSHSKLASSSSTHRDQPSCSTRTTNFSSKPVVSSSPTASRGLHSYTHKRSLHTKPSASRLHHKTSPPHYSARDRK